MRSCDEHPFGSAAAFAALVAVGLSAAACGGSTPPPQVSTAKSAARQARRPASTAGADRVGGRRAPRPTRSSRATRRRPTTAASRPGPRAICRPPRRPSWMPRAARRGPGGPRYSLGCVLERLGRQPGRARRLPGLVQRELEVRGRDGRLRACCSRARGGEATPSSSSPASSRRTPDSARLLVVPRRGEVDRGGQPRLPAARPAGAGQAARLQGRDGRHRAGLLPRPPLGPREVRAPGHPRRAGRRLHPAARQGKRRRAPAPCAHRARVGRPQACARRLRAGGRAASRSLRGVHQPRRDEARGGQRHRSASDRSRRRFATRPTCRSRTSIWATAIACWVGRGTQRRSSTRRSAWTRRSPGVHYDLGLLYLFSPNVPGVTGQDDQLAKAIQELETYRSMRSAKAAQGPGRRRGRAPQHRQAQAERASVEEAGRGGASSARGSAARRRRASSSARSRPPAPSSAEPRGRSARRATSCASLPK